MTPKAPQELTKDELVEIIGEIMDLALSNGSNLFNLNELYYKGYSEGIKNQQDLTIDIFRKHELF